MHRGTLLASVDAPRVVLERDHGSAIARTVLTVERMRETLRRVKGLVVLDEAVTPARFTSVLRYGGRVRASAPGGLCCRRSVGAQRLEPRAVSPGPRAVACLLRVAQQDTQQFGVVGEARQR